MPVDDCSSDDGNDDDGTLITTPTKQRRSTLVLSLDGDYTVAADLGRPVPFGVGPTIDPSLTESPHDDAIPSSALQEVRACMYPVLPAGSSDGKARLTG